MTVPTSSPGGWSRTLPVALKIALREMRGGLSDFTVFLLCLVLGVAAIAAVGSVRDAIRAGLTEQGAVLLGGEAEMSFTYRRATDAERAFMNEHAAAVSEVVAFRSMAVRGEGDAAERALTEVKAIDDAYPLTGNVVLDPAMPLSDALKDRGAVMDGVLMDRLGLKPGDHFRLGTTEFRVSARLMRVPDTGGGFSFGPPTIVRSADLEGSGLLAPGSLYDTHYRLMLRPGQSLVAVKAAARAAFDQTGLRWLDARKGAPGAERFVTEMGSFLVLVGLAGLAVGGVGISSAVRTYLDGKTATIAALKAMGADSATILAAYLAQVALIAGIGIVLGLMLGAALPVIAEPYVTARLPLPIALGIRPWPLAEAALYGALTAALFALWPLARTRDVRAAALFRDLGASARAWPGKGMVAVLGGLLLALVVSVLALSAERGLAAGTMGGVAAALAMLTLAAWALRRLARRLARLSHGRPALRLALAAIGGPRSEATSVVLSLGLGLSVLAAVGQIDANLRASIDRDLPKVAPAFFFVDIQQDQIDGFRATLAADSHVTRVETAPMLRAIVTKINGEDPHKIAGDHWVLKGDRGLTYADRPPPGTTITAGTWWPEGYQGEPQMSFAADEAKEMHLKLGDTVTVNVLGRDITARITSFRAVNFGTAGLGFVMAMNPGALAGAPHSWIATVYGAKEGEAGILREIGSAYSNVTAISVREVIGRVTEALSAIAEATTIAAGVTLLTGAVVLIGAAAAGEAARTYEAALLKTLGATRGRVLASFALRSAMTGLAAGIIAVAFGAAAGWAVMHFVMHAPYRFVPVSALVIVAGGALATLVTGLLFALRPLAVRPARVLRAQT